MTAEGLMSSPPVTTGVDADVTAAARLMFVRDIKRLPVLDGDRRLAGIISRHDLVRAFVRPDEDIRAEVVDDILVRVLCVDPASVTVTVTEGVVRLTGQVERKSMIGLTSDLIHRVDGVVTVESRLTYGFDDTRIGDGTVPENRGIFHG
jgi:CBS domain-containing protein